MLSGHKHVRHCPLSGYFQEGVLDFTSIGCQRILRKKNAEYTNVWNFTRLLHVVKARNFKPRCYHVTEREKKSIDCNVIKGKTITKSNILRQGRINSMKTKINNFLFMSFLGYITNAGRNVCNGTHPMLTIPSQAVTLKPDLSYILHKCCQYSKSVLG